MKKIKNAAAVISAVIFSISPAVIPVHAEFYAEQTDDISKYIQNYDTLSEAYPILFSGNQLLITFVPMIQVQGCVIMPDEIKWEVSGTADVEYTEDSFFKSCSYEENYAMAYCLVTASGAGTVIIEAAEKNSSTGSESKLFCIQFNVDETGSFDGTTKERTAGDATGDGIIDVRDVTVLNQHIVKLTELSGMELKNADVTGDGTVDLKDLGMIKKYITKQKVFLR